MSVRRSIFYTFLTQIPTLILGVVTSIFLTNILGPEGKGNYTIFVSDIELFSMFLSFSYAYAIIYFVANGKIAIDKLVGVGLTVILTGVILLTAFLAGLHLFLGGGFAIPDGFNEPFFLFYIIAAFTLNLVNTLVSAIFQGKTLFRFVNLGAVLNSVFNVVAFGIMLICKEYYHVSFSMEEVLGASLGVLLLNTIVWGWFYFTRVKVKPSFSFKLDNEVKQVFTFSGVNYLAHIVNFLNYNLDFYIVREFRGAEELGYYSLAVGLSRMAWMITNPISMVLVPHLTRITTKEERTALFSFYSRVNFTLVMLFIASAFLLAGFVIPLLFKEFAESVWPFRLLLMGILFSCMAKVFSLYPYAINKVKYNLIANLAGVVVTIVLDLLLIPSMGIEGACIATNLSYLTIFAVTCYFVFGRLGLPFANYLLVTPADIRSKGRPQPAVAQEEKAASTTV